MNTAAPRRWVLATGNAGKIAEFRALLGPAGMELLSLAEFAITGPEETGESFVENAILKARHAAAATGLPAIADDSGLVVPALGGSPGVRSARFAGPQAGDQANMQRLLEALTGMSGTARAATFCCCVVAMRSPSDPAPIIAEGRWAGVIADVPRGAEGFGYDPIFVDLESGRTAAELSRGEKNARSHRGRAAAVLAARLAAPDG